MYQELAYVLSLFCIYLLVTLTGDGEFHVHGHCYEGVLNKSPLKIASGHSASELAIPQAALSYSSSGLFKEITSTKYARLMQMCKLMIDYNRNTIINYEKPFEVCSYIMTSKCTLICAFT